jgi:hypothetical protein
LSRYRSISYSLRLLLLCERRPDAMHLVTLVKPRLSMCQKDPAVFFFDKVPNSVELKLLTRENPAHLSRRLIKVMAPTA